MTATVSAASKRRFNLQRAKDLMLAFVQNTKAPILLNNSEVELSALVNLCYLSARNKCRVEREDKAGKGFVDFINMKLFTFGFPSPFMEVES